MNATEAIAVQAGRLHDARRGRTPIPQAEENHLELEDAYRVQAAGMALRRTEGERLIGAKLGFTSRGKMLQMGVHDMIVGQLTDNMRIDDGGAFNRETAIHPRVEPEIAFLIAEDFGDVDDDSMCIRIEAVACAMEIIDSRYRDFRFSLSDVVADNTSACAFVIGPWRTVPPCLANRGMRMTFDGVARQVGSSAAILGNPMRAINAAHRLARAQKLRFPAGSILLAGAATPAEPVPPQGFIEVEVSGLGRAGFHVE